MWENDYLDKSFRNMPQNIYLSVTAKPTVSILTSVEAKNYCKINNSVDDSLIDLLIKSSIGSIENVIHKQISKASFSQKQNGGITNIKLLKCPVIGTPTIYFNETFDSTGTLLVSNADFRLVGNVLYHTNDYFIEGRQGDGYSISYDAGLFTSSTDDNSMEYTIIKNCMLRMVAFLYENRQQYCTNYNEENWAINYNYMDIPVEVKNMLLPFRESNLGVL
jgi:hypothetical protein